MPGPPPKAAARAASAAAATSATTSAHCSVPATHPPCPAACAGKPKPYGTPTGKTSSPASPGPPTRRGTAMGQVTVLFADVVHSMDIAAAVGAERLREIMAELIDRCTKVVQRYGGTVDKFTGDGIMAVFGALTPLSEATFKRFRQ